MLTLHECREIVKKNLISNEEFIITQYELNPFVGSQTFQLKITILLNNIPREVNFVGKLKSVQKEIFLKERHGNYFNDNCPYVSDFVLKRCLENEKVMIFEDLFIPAGKKLDLDHIKLTLATLAKVHSEGIRYEMEKSVKQPINGHSVKNQNIFKSAWYKTQLEGLIALMSLNSDNGKTQQSYKNGIYNIVGKFQTLIDTEHKFRKVLSNGCMWNNVLFQYQQTDRSSHKDFTTNGNAVSVSLHNGEFILNTNEYSINNGLNKVIQDGDKLIFNNDDVGAMEIYNISKNDLSVVEMASNSFKTSPKAINNISNNNNLLLPSKCKFMTFNGEHYLPPAFDVLQFIYIETNRKMRQHHLKFLLEFYYDCLKTELTNKNLDIETVLPLKEDYELSVRYLLPIVKLQVACLRQKYFTSTLSEGDQTIQEKMAETILELKEILKQPKLTVEDCFEIIENKLGTTNYELIGYNSTRLEKISGFLGDHQKLKIDVNFGNKKMTLNMFAKFMPMNGAAVSIASDMEAFYKEMFIYEKFVPLLKEMGIDLINSCVVPCYFTRHDLVMVFDDFGIFDYKTLEPRQPYSYDIVKLVIKKIAKFHASSIILEEKLSEKLKTTYRLVDHFERELQEVFFSRAKNHNGIKTQRTAINTVEHELDLFPDPNQHISQEEMKLKVRKAYEKMYDLVEPATKFRNVVCHGDLWVSNILIQHANEEPMDCRFIDYQICRYCTPAHDLLNFIFLTTDRQLRNQHMDEIIDLYYGEFSKNLEIFDCDINKIYPYETFMESLDHMMPQVVCQTVLYYQLTLTNSDIVKEYLATEELARNILLGDRRDFVSDMVKRDPLFRYRAGESIQDLREMCMKYF